MKPQLNIFHNIIEAGQTYVCSKPWTNEMGYKWKIGEKVIVEIVGINSCHVGIPKDVQSFDILMDRLIENFELKSSTEVKPPVVFNEDYDDYEDDDESAYDDCPKCGRTYDEIDYEYQACSKCGWDEEKQKWCETRQPSDQDYMNGDADILTDQWN